MRIAFDGTTLRPGRTGVGYYTEHLLHELAGMSADDLIVMSNRGIDTTLPLPDGVQVAIDAQGAGRRVPRMVWMQMLAPRMLQRLAPDVAHFTNGIVPLASTIPAVVTIYDMSLTLYPRYHPLRRALLNRPLVNLAARRADAIITISESSKRDIVKLYGLGPERVHVIHGAAAQSFRPVRDLTERDRVRQRYGLADRFVLYVGTIEPRKNLPKLIEGFAKLRKVRKLDHQLVCAGPYGWLSGDLDGLIKRLGIEDAVRFTGYVPFEDLPALYSLAEMFVYPSLFEGFGLPVIEAMACGTPVITGRVSALAEVAGSAVERTDRLDADSLEEAMASLASNRDRREELSALGLERARTFSWERAARETLDVYRLVASRYAPAGRVRKPIVTRLDMRESSGPGVPSPAAEGVAAPSAGAGLDVLFGQAYFLRFDPKLWAAQQPYAPLGALYAASCVRKHGYGVALFDAMLASSEAEWTEALERHHPRFAIIYEDSFNYLSKMCLLRMREAALRMIDAARERGITVIVGGSDASDHPAIYLNRGATLVIVGEGETTLVEALDVLSGRSDRPLTSVHGVCVSDEAGGVLRTPARQFVRDLDLLPRPAWDLVDVERYRAIWTARHGYFSINIATTRGCPYHCNWCAKPIYGQRYTARSPEDVVDEIAWLKRTYHPDHLWIADDIFGLKPGWIERFAELVTRRGAVIPFKCLLRADGVSEPIAAALGAAGCRTAWIGAESGSQRILDAMEKGTRVDQIGDATRRLRKAGVEVGFFLQFGYPGETFADIESTLQMVRECRPDDIGVSVSYPLPGTAFHERVKAQLGEKQNWIDSDDLDTLFRATYVPGFYRALHALVHAEFRARKGSVAGLYHSARLPLLRRQLRALARDMSGPEPVPVPVPVLSRRAAAIPSEQPH
jgi:anaerobic magnesium-protoporphyrin IX monomethyl ester cyclase